MECHFIGTPYPITNKFLNFNLFILFFCLVNLYFAKHAYEKTKQLFITDIISEYCQCRSYFLCEIYKGPSLTCHKN